MNKVATNFDARFHFTSSDVDQIALLFFLGQDGMHQLDADYVALSYVKGHVLMTWDMGSGIATDLKTTRHVSSMIPLARSTVSPVVITIFI